MSHIGVHTAAVHNLTRSKVAFLGPRKDPRAAHAEEQERGHACHSRRVVTGSWQGVARAEAALGESFHPTDRLGRAGRHRRWRRAVQRELRSARGEAASSPSCSGLPLSAPQRLHGPTALRATRSGGRSSAWKGLHSAVGQGAAGPGGRTLLRRPSPCRGGLRTVEGVEANSWPQT